MEEIAKNEAIDFILNTGDNFHNHDSFLPKRTQKVEQQKKHWINLHKNYPHIQRLPCYRAIGNHDYKKKGWRDGDFFWSQTIIVEGKTLVIVNLDTCFLAYGASG